MSDFASSRSFRHPCSESGRGAAARQSGERCRRWPTFPGREEQAALTPPEPAALRRVTVLRSGKRALPCPRRGLRDGPRGPRRRGGLRPPPAGLAAAASGTPAGWWRHGIKGGSAFVRPHCAVAGRCERR